MLIRYSDGREHEFLKNSQCYKLWNDSLNFLLVQLALLTSLQCVKFLKISDVPLCVLVVPKTAMGANLSIRRATSLSVEFVSS